LIDDLPLIRRECSLSIAPWPLGWGAFLLGVKTGFFEDKNQGFAD
jgi:hypothetical protein